MKKQPSQSARRIPAEQFQVSVQSTTDAQAQARKLIAKAKHEAQTIVAQAEEAAAAQQRSLIELSNKELRSFIDEDRLKRHARSFVTVLSEINTIRKSHEDMAPWLIDLVEVSLHRIIGEMDSAEVTARIVRQGIRELHDSQNVQLFAHPDIHDHAKRVKTDYPAMMASVTDIAVDSGLPKDTVKLSCSIGETELCVQGRLDRVIEAIRSSPQLRPPPKVTT